MRVCNEHHSVEMKTYTAALMSNFNQKQIQNNFINLSDGAPCYNSWRLEVFNYRHKKNPILDDAVVLR